MSNRASFVTLAAGLTAALALLVPPVGSAAPARHASRLAGSIAPGAWRTWWGTSAFAPGSVTLSSTVPTAPAETHSALVTTAGSLTNGTIAVDTTTLDQLRVGSAPNPWEVGWVMFRFRDLSDYYYFILKPDGFELGKKQGSLDQIFLATGTAPSLAVGGRHHIVIQLQGPRIRVAVDGSQVVDFTDPNPLPGGSVGLYEEDSQVRFDSFTANSA